MNNLFVRIPSIALLCGALLFGSITPSLRASAHQTSDNSEENLQTECQVCFESFTDDTIVIQYDCNDTTNPHFCLNCAEQIKMDACPFCRKVDFKVHDPRVNKQGSKHMHHRHKPLTPAEEQQLNAYLRNMGQHRISLKAAPDSALRHCSTCDTEVEADSIVLQLACGHSLCLADAAKLATGKKAACPTCKKGLIVLDPLQKNDKDQPILKYLLRTPTKEEATRLTQVRSSRHVTLSQAHIPEHLRVPVAKAAPQAKKPASAKKDSPAKKPSPTKKDTPLVSPSKKDLIPEVPEKFTQDFTEEEYAANYAEQADLPIIKGMYPVLELSDEDKRLNMHLPTNLDPRDWQVILQDEEGNLARMKRTKRLSTYPTHENIDNKGLENVPNFLKGYSGDVIAGLCVGMLIGQDIHKADRFSPKPWWLVYGAAAFGAYTLVKKANPKRTTIKPKYALRWVAGIGAGILAHKVLGS